jgi:hypothetical protein
MQGERAERLAGPDVWETCRELIPAGSVFASLAEYRDALFRSLSNAMRHQGTWFVCGVTSVSMVAGGWLIQTLAGRRGGAGARRKRPGLAAWACWRTRARRAWIWVAVPSWTDAGVCRPMPEWRCSLL